MRSLTLLSLADPYQPIGALRTCLTIGPDPLRSASTKLPFAAYGGWPERPLAGSRFEASQFVNIARLLKRVFDIDMEHCPNCGGGELGTIAAILERPVIGKILTHLGR